MNDLDQRLDPAIYKHLPVVYSVFTAVWFLALLIWPLHLWFYRKQPLPLRFHSWLTLIPLCKLCGMIGHLVTSYLCLYHNASKCKLYVVMPLTSLDIVSEVVVFASLMFMAKGYMVTRTDMENQEKKAIIWNAFCLGICQVAKQMNSFFSFPLYVMYIILLYHVLLSISMNVRLLERHKSFYEENYDQTLVSSMTAAQQQLFLQRRRGEDVEEEDEDSTITESDDGDVSNDDATESEIDHHHHGEEMRNRNVRASDAAEAIVYGEDHDEETSMTELEGRRLNRSQQHGEDSDDHTIDVDDNGGRQPASHVSLTVNRGGNRSNDAIAQSSSNQQNSGEPDLIRIPPVQKLALFKHMKQIIMAFLVVNLIVSIAFLVTSIKADSKEDLRKFSWLEQTMREVVYSMSLLVLGFLWRVRDFSYYYQTFATEAVELQLALSGILDRFDQTFDTENHPSEEESVPERSIEEEMRELHLAKPPRFTRRHANEEEEVDPSSVPVLVIQNPCRYHGQQHLCSALALSSVQEPPLDTE